MDLFGQLMVCLAALLSAVGGALVLGGNYSQKALESGKKLLHAGAISAAASLLVLVFLLLVHDYRISYIRDYADRTMSSFYLVTAIWGGQQGSLLVWAALQTFFTSSVALTHFSKNRNLVPVALAFLAAVQVLFLGLVLFHSNPFDPLGTVAIDGIGLNPLLRNPYMIVHPPTLYLGFVGFSVPMAFAIAALVEGQVAENWPSEIRLFVLFAWVFLGVGNILGMVWAYQELGWGGYWNWDPVENASFMPWLTGTALLHSALMLRSKKQFSLWCLSLTWLTFVLIVFGTFLTRSNIIESVHAFSGATTGPYFLGLIISVTALTLGLFIWRRRDLFRDNPMDSWISREGFFYITNVVFVLSAVFVWLATMAPLFAELIKGEKAAVTPEFFNKWMVPLGLSILALIGLCLLFSKAKKDAIKKSIIPISAGAVASLIVTLTQNANAPGNGIGKPALAFGIAVAVAVMVFRELWTILRHFTAGNKPKKSAQKRLGAQVIHVSVILLFIGFTGSAFTNEETANLAPGQSMQVGNYSLKFLSLRDDTDFERHALVADVEVKSNGQSRGILSPARHTYHSHPDRPTNEVAIRTTILDDLFLILGNADPSSGGAVIKAIENPLVVWIWIGGVLLVLGTLIAFVPPEHKESSPGVKEKTPRKVRTAGLVVGIAATGLASGLIGNPVAGVAALTGVCIVGVIVLFGDAMFHLLAPRGRK